MAEDSAELPVEVDSDGLDLPRSTTPELADDDFATAKEPAPSPELRLGQVEVFHCIAIDLSELLESKVEDFRLLQKLRAQDSFYPLLWEALHQRLPGCAPEAERIQVRMTESLSLGGKAVWTDQFLERFAPLRLPHTEKLVYNGANVNEGDRVSLDPNSCLHFVKFQGSSLRIYRDGTVAYTVRMRFEERRRGESWGRHVPPASIRSAIERLELLDGLIPENFGAVLRQLLRDADFRERIQQVVRLEVQSDGLRLAQPNSVVVEELRRKSEEHRVFFVEKFYDGDQLEQHGLLVPGPQQQNLEGFKVNLQRVLQSTSLPGLLNTASWYEEYNQRYVRSLISKEIGYRNDEIYLTDRKATVVCTEGVWREQSAANGRPDPLTRFKWDIVLAVEYNVTRLAYCSATLDYYQTHPDVRNVEEAEPLAVLANVIDGRAILSRIDESLDLTLLVDHGFTRVFINRLRAELGLDTAIGFIRKRIADASVSVSLKSSVLAAENTSVESLKAATENNALQLTIRRWAIVAILVAIASFAADKLIDANSEPPETSICVQQQQPGSGLPLCERREQQQGQAGSREDGQR